MMILNLAPLMNADVEADWPKCKYAIQVELDSLTKRTVLGPVVPIPSGIKPVDINGSLLESVVRERDIKLALWRKASHNALESTTMRHILS